jgi:hypothetical protein
VGNFHWPSLPPPNAAKRLLPAIACTWQIYMEWHGMEWARLGMAWNGPGLAWHGMGPAWHGMEWARLGLAWNGLAWNGPGLAWHGMGPAWLDIGNLKLKELLK